MAIIELLSWSGNRVLIPANSRSVLFPPVQNTRALPRWTMDETAQQSDKPWRYAQESRLDINRMFTICSEMKRRQSERVIPAHQSSGRPTGGHRRLLLRVVTGGYQGVHRLIMGDAVKRAVFSCARAEIARKIGVPGGQKTRDLKKGECNSRWIRTLGVSANTMSLQSVRAFIQARAPDIAIIETADSSSTVELAAKAHCVAPAQIAKTICLGVGEKTLLIVGERDRPSRQSEGQGCLRRQGEHA
jgi:hypothetical protein